MGKEKKQTHKYFRLSPDEIMSHELLPMMRKWDSYQSAKCGFQNYERTFFLRATNCGTSTDDEPYSGTVWTA